MPNYFAHLTFGARVLAHLPEDLRTSLEERAAFDLGCLGPDPLFFYHPATGNPARREGLKMHKCSALPAFRRLRAAVEECVPMSRGYAAGFCAIWRWTAPATPMWRPGPPGGSWPTWPWRRSLTGC